MFKIKNKDIPYIYEFMIELKLPFKYSRKRAKFLDLIQSHYTITYENGRKELIDNYAVKDENGQVKTTEKGVEIHTKDLEAFNSEMSLLEHELFQLDLMESNVELLKDIYFIVSNEEYIETLNGLEALAHDTLCTELERVLSK